MAKNTSYGQILKATSIFGGVQVFNILVNLVRSKCVSVLLGPAGMGIIGMLTVVTTFIGSATSFGLATSAVKTIATARSSDDEGRAPEVVAVVRSLVWITGVFGGIVCLFFSRAISELSFGNQDYTQAFQWLSITLLIKQLSSGQLAILQGFQKIRLIAKATTVGGFGGLVVSVPMYYFFGVDGIVPSLVVSSLVSFFFSWRFSSQIQIRRASASFSLLKSEGAPMLTMGFLLSISGLMTIAASYVLRLLISREGGIEHVGLYNAGFAIVNSYVGMIFTAMGTDYYPRLSSVAHNKVQFDTTVNQQAEIAILIISPILIFFVLFIEQVVLVLYSNEFLPITGMLHWASLGMFFRAVSWTIGFIILAKGDAKLFFWTELASNCYMLGFNILGYSLGGLDGVGVAFLAGYALHLVQMTCLGYFRYRFALTSTFYYVFLGQGGLALFVFIGLATVENPYRYLVGGVGAVLSLCYSYTELESRIGLRAKIGEMMSKFRKQ